MKRIIWTFGLISGGILVAMMLITMPFEGKIGYDRALILGYTTMVVSFLLVYFGIRSYRDNVGGGVVSFGRAVVVGISIVVIASVCYVAAWEAVYFKVTPDYQQKILSAAIERARAAGGSQAEIDRRVAEATKFDASYHNPLFNAAITFTEPLPVGIVIALVSAGVLRRRRDGAVTALATSTVS